MALGHNIPGAFLTLAALRGNTQFKLNIVKAHPCTHMAMDFPIRNSLADTDNHGLPLFGGL